MSLDTDAAARLLAANLFSSRYCSARRSGKAGASYHGGGKEERSDAKHAPPTIVVDSLFVRPAARRYFGAFPVRPFKNVTFDLYVAPFKM
jgi:hypothetical protein